MHVVALMKLGGPMEPEAAALAVDLGIAPYDARMLLTGTPPCIVSTVAEQARAQDLAGRMQRRGNGVVCLDGARIVATEAMTSMRRFRLEPQGIGAGGEQGDAWLPYEDVFAILRAVHRTTMAHKETVVERKMRPGAALMTGGVVMSSTTKKEIDQKQDDRENVLYLFRRSGERPWILQETQAKYTGLGADLQPTSVLNFQRTIKILRERMTFATYDDRLVGVRRIPERISSNVAGTRSEVTSGSGVDLLAHVLASWIASSHETPYR